MTISPVATVSQPRYLPSVNYIQRIYHSDVFVLLDDCQHQRRAFENRNRVIKPQKDLQKTSQWLTLCVDKSKSSRPLIKDVKLASLKEDLYKHASVLQNVYGKSSLAYQAFSETCLAVASRIDLDHSLPNFCLLQILEIYKFLEIDVHVEIIRASRVPGNSAGSSRIIECCLEVGAKTYLSGPNGREYLVAEEFEQNGLGILYHDFVFPEYPQVGSGNFLPWMAWVDMLDAVGKDAFANLVIAPPSLRFS